MGSGGISPRKFLNPEALKYPGFLTQQFLSNIFGNLIATFVFSSAFRDIRVKYPAFPFLLGEFNENITTRVEIGIFPIPIAYWSGFGIFKQNRDNPDSLKFSSRTLKIPNRKCESRLVDNSTNYLTLIRRSYQNPLPNLFSLTQSLYETLFHWGPWLQTTENAMIK